MFLYSKYISINKLKKGIINKLWNIECDIYGLSKKLKFKNKLRIKSNIKSKSGKIIPIIIDVDNSFLFLKRWLNCSPINALIPVCIII